MSKKDDYTKVLMEDINGKFDLIMEMVTPMRKELAEIRVIVDDIPEMKNDIEVIKKVVKETNVQVHDHEQRIAKLEKART